LAVARSSIATVATDLLCGCEAQHRNRSFGGFIIATVAAIRVVSVAKLSIATVATDHVAVATLSTATIATVATDQVVLVATPLSQPSQPVNYPDADLSERKKVTVL
jgi:hypothetical protein